MNAPGPHTGPPADSAPDTVLEVHDLHVGFSTDHGRVHAVRGVSFALRRGRVLALVGESGCGKSVTARALLRLIEPPGRIERGRIVLHPSRRETMDTPVDGSIDIAALHDGADALYAVRGGLVSMVFQEPASALSPVHTIGEQIAEVVRLHERATRDEARRRAIAMLAQVGVPEPERRYGQYAHELSGGLRQRAVIAMALVCRPGVLIADEPTTALDVTLQAQILGLIKRMQAGIGCSVLLITHNMGVVAQMADEVAVMYLGRIVEHGLVERVLKAPRHPYTIGLMRSIPSLHGPRGPLPSIAGAVPSARETPSGCAYHPRCGWARSGLCDVGVAPDLRRLRRRLVACHRAEDILAEQEGGPYG